MHVHASPGGSEKTSRILRFSLVVTAAYIVLLVVAGIRAHSLALLSEAGHNLSDFFALLLSLALLKTRAIPAWIAYLGMVLGVLFIADRVLFDPLHLISPLVAILWAFSLAFSLLRTREATGN